LQTSALALRSKSKFKLRSLKRVQNQTLFSLKRVQNQTLFSLEVRSKSKFIFFIGAFKIKIYFLYRCVQNQTLFSLKRVQNANLSYALAEARSKRKFKLCSLKCV
jgi:hypothetical protein